MIAKKMKFRKVLTLFLFFLLLLKADCVQANEQDTEKAFYAISSLIFHVEELTPKVFAADRSSTVYIPFTTGDVAKLWDLALLDKSIKDEIKKAKDGYYIAVNNRRMRTQFYNLCIKTTKILKKVWEKLDSKLLGNECQKAPFLLE